ncbi:MAG: SDR family NAD(P)-dependent oxidoreductase [Geminicoccaceae bacterium]
MRTILITGASSGLGEALALAYAGAGSRLILMARRQSKLASVAASCSKLGADVVVRTIDVTDRAAMAEALEDLAPQFDIDLVIANAGTSGALVDRGGEVDPEVWVRTVNVDGVLNTIEPLIPHYRTRGRGQIAIMSSLASYRGLPGAGAYCASKAFVRVWGEALRLDLIASGVSVSVICPGFVATPLTEANPFPMPFIVQADRAAAVIKAGLDRRKALITFPWPMVWLVRLMACLPPVLADRLLRRSS